MAPHAEASGAYKCLTDDKRKGHGHGHARAADDSECLCRAAVTYDDVLDCRGEERESAYDHEVDGHEPCGRERVR